MENTKGLTPDEQSFLWNLVQKQKRWQRTESIFRVIVLLAVAITAIILAEQQAELRTILYTVAYLCSGLLTIWYILIGLLITFE